MLNLAFPGTEGKFAAYNWEIPHRAVGLVPVSAFQDFLHQCHQAGGFNGTSHLFDSSEMQVQADPQSL